MNCVHFEVTLGYLVYRAQKLTGGLFFIGTVVSNCGGSRGVYVFAESVFIVCPGAGMTEKLSKLELRGPQEFQVRNCYVNINISSEGDIIKLSTKGRSSWVVLLFVIKTNSFRGGGS